MGTLAYLMVVMWVCLATAFLIGFILSYLWRRARYRKLTADNEQSWLSRLRQTEQDRDARIAKLTSEVDEQRQQIPTMERSLAERSDIINAHETKIDEQKQSIDALESKLHESLTAQIESEDQNGAIAQLRQTLEARDASLANAGRELEQLREKHNATNERAANAERTLAQKTSEYESRLDALGAQAETASAKAQRLQAVEPKVAELETELSAANRRVQEMENDHREQQSLSDRANKQIEELQRNVDHLVQERDGLSEQIQAAERHVASKDAAESDALNATIRSLRDEVAGHVQRAAQAELRKNELEQSLRTRTDRLDVAERACGELRQKVIELESEFVRERDQRAAAVDERNALSERAQKELDELNAMRREREELLQQLDNRKEVERRAEQHADHWQSEHDKLKAQLANEAGLLVTSRNEADAARKQSEEATAAADEAKHRIVEMQRRLDQAEHEAATRAREDQQRLAQLEEQAGKSERHVDEVAMLRRTLEQRDVEYAKEHRQHSEQRKLAKDWRRRYEALKNELSTTDAPRPAKSSKTDQPKWLLSKAPAEKDDLKKIWGVGPVMEKTMNKLGIYLFRQVAALRKKDIEWVASHINTFPDRINRDDWVGQAAALRKEKYGR
ncbi:MAG: hypothetical protein AAF465_08320 [Pseudomonadota bacterium]